MKISKSALYKKTSIINVASYLEIPENRVGEILDQFCIALEGNPFSNKKFIDYLVDEIEQN